jgi:hypothetical protein
VRVERSKRLQGREKKILGIAIGITRHNLITAVRAHGRSRGPTARAKTEAAVLAAGLDYAEVMMARVPFYFGDEDVSFARLVMSYVSAGTQRTLRASIAVFDLAMLTWYVLGARNFFKFFFFLFFFHSYSY